MGTAEPRAEGAGPAGRQAGCKVWPGQQSPEDCSQLANGNGSPGSVRSHSETLSTHCQAEAGDKGHPLPAEVQCHQRQALPGRRFLSRRARTWHHSFFG